MFGLWVRLKSFFYEYGNFENNFKDQDGEHMYIHGWFMSVYGKTTKIL